MPREEGRRNWARALLLVGLYDVFVPIAWSTLIGLCLIGAALFEWRRTQPGGRTVAAAALLIISGFLRLASVDGNALHDALLGLLGLAEAPAAFPLASLLGLVIAAVQLLWAAAELRRFRRALERGE